MILPNTRLDRTSSIDLIVLTASLTDSHRFSGAIREEDVLLTALEVPFCLTIGELKGLCPISIGGVLRAGSCIGVRDHT